MTAPALQRQYRKLCLDQFWMQLASGGKRLLIYAHILFTKLHKFSRPNSAVLLHACPRHLSSGVVQLFLQFFPLFQSFFPARFCFISSRNFRHLSAILKTCELISSFLPFSDRNAYWSMAAMGQWCF